MKKTDDPTLEIRKLALMAIVSDDELMDRLVLKGGNALALLYNTAGRPSIDLDFSMSDDFRAEDLEGIRHRISQNLQNTFAPNGYTVFGFDLREKPSKLDPGLKDFWGGYEITFKVLPTEIYQKYEHDTGRLNRSAMQIGKRKSRTRFSIEVSKYEYCNDKTAHTVGGFTVYVYTREMIIAEKLRAICQQMPEYRLVVFSQKATPRAKDFWDIYYLMKNNGIDLADKNNIELLKAMFKAKKVDLKLLSKIREKDVREFHEKDFPHLLDTIPIGERPKNVAFKLLYDFVVREVSKIEKVL